MNLYYPSAWLEQASRDLEYKLATRTPITGKDTGLLAGIASVDPAGYGWLATVAFINVWNIPTNVPAWVYTHASKPR